MISTTHSIVSDFARVESIASQLTSEYKTLAVFSGSYGGSAMNELLGNVKTSIGSIAPFKTEAEEIGHNYGALMNAAIEDLSSTVARLAGHLAKIHALRDDLVTQLSSVSAQNQLYREKRIIGSV